jgi:multidrug efflux pump subunit AcrA (membrane-fusion protein)
MTLDLVEQEIAVLKANYEASNAHCTIMTRAATTAKADLDHQKRTTRQAVKTSERYVAHPAIEDQWNASQQDKAQHAKEATEVEAQKATVEALHEACIQEEIRTRSFSSKSDLHSFHFNV